MAKAATIASAMTEAELEEHVRALCKDLGLYRHHAHDSRRAAHGFPDDVIFGTAILFRELKSERGTLKPDQEMVRDRILAAGGNWALWRPSDLLSRRIHRELTAISALKAGAA